MSDMNALGITVAVSGLALAFILAIIANKLQRIIELLTAYFGGPK